MSENSPEQPSSPVATATPPPAPAPTAAPANPAQQRQRASQLAQALRLELQKALIGQTEVIDDDLAALFAGGHVLVEGVPGLGKTLLVRALARFCELMCRHAGGAAAWPPITRNSVAESKRKALRF